MALTPGFLGVLGELPIVEAGAEAGGNRLLLLRPFVVAEAVVGKSKGFREQPAFAIVLVQEGLDAFFPVAAAGADLFFKIVKGNEG